VPNYHLQTFFFGDFARWESKIDLQSFLLYFFVFSQEYNEDNQWIRLVLKMIEMDDNGIIELLQHAKTKCSFTKKVTDRNHYKK